MVNPNLTAALRLASKGIAVFPCKPDKTPCDGVRWRSEATTDPRRIEAWWRRWPDAVPAYEPGKHGQLVIDCDRHGGPDGVAIFEAMARDHGDDPRDWPTVQTPSTGRHVSFANPARLTNARGALPAGIDVRGSGGYVVAEGSTLPDGRRYAVPDGYNGIVDALEADAMPPLPGWLTDILTARKAAPAPAPVATVETRATVASNTRERMAFEAALQAETRNVSTAGEGNRNATLNTAAFNLFQMVASGWGSSSEVETELTAAAFAAGLRQPEVAKTIASGRKAGMAKPRGKLEDRGPSSDIATVPITTINGITVNATTGEVIELPDDQDDDQDDETCAPPIDEGLTHVGGVHGEIVEFIVSTSRRPNRRMALSAALPLLGTLLGRRMATPTGAGLHLYVIVTSPTGSGKQHQLDAIDRLMRAVDLQRHVGPSQFMSMSALIKHVQAAPLSICAQDEFGAMLGRLSHPRASGHEQGISAVMRSLWGASFTTIRTPAYATAASVEIAGPALSIYGPTTAQELYESLRGRDVVNGFLNRFLVIDAGERAHEVAPSISLRDVPDRLRASLLEMYRMGEPSTGNLTGGVLCKSAAPDPRAIELAWANAEAEHVYRDLSRRCQERMDADLEAEPFMSRVAEIALRCATIYACGERTTVTARHMQWGAALAWQSAERLMTDAGRYMTDVLGAAEFERKLLSKLRATRQKMMTMRQLHRSMQRHFRFARDLENAITALTKSQVIEVQSIPMPGGKRVVVRLL